MERIPTATTPLYLESNAVLMGMAKIQVPRNKTKGLDTKMTKLKHRRFELETKWRQSSRHATIAKVREEAVNMKLARVKREPAVTRVECAYLRWKCNEMVSSTQQQTVEVNEALMVVCSS